MNNMESVKRYINAVFLETSYNQELVAMYSLIYGEYLKEKVEDYLRYQKVIRTSKITKHAFEQLLPFVELLSLGNEEYWLAASKDYYQEEKGEVPTDRQLLFYLMAGRFPCVINRHMSAIKLRIGLTKEEVLEILEAESDYEESEVEL